MESFFHWADYVVLFVMLAASAAVGFYYACSGGKQKTTKEFYLADGKMHWFPVACSLTASYLSSDTIIGAPAEIYSFGTIFMYQALGAFIGVLLGLFFLPVFEQNGVITSFQHIERRFNRPLKMIALVSFLLNMLFISAISLYGPALSISAVTGINIWLAVLSVAAISVLYTLLGGIKAVYWTDAIQLVIMMVGIFIVLIYGTITEGGISKVWEVNRISGRLDILEPEKAFIIDPRMRHTFWSMMSSTSLGFAAIYGTSQMSVQRYLSMGSKKDRIIAYLLTAFGIGTLALVSSLTGLVIFSHFRHCDPLTTGEIFTRDQLYPLYVMRLLGHLPGLPGLILSSVFSGSLSSVSSILSAAAMLILNEFILPYKRDLSDSTAAIISKVLVLVFGSLNIVLVLFAKNFGTGIMSIGIAISGTISGPTVAIFTAGVFLPVVNWKGALTGFMVGTGYSMLVGMGGFVNPGFIYEYPVSTDGCNITDPVLLANLTSPTYDPSTWDPQSHFRSGFESLFDLSYAYNSIGGIVATLIVAVITSILFSKEDDPLVEQNKLSPYLLKSCCLMPASWRAKILLETGETQFSLENEEKDSGEDNDAMSKMESPYELSNDNTSKL